jgi:hypothetical protein
MNDYSIKAIDTANSKKTDRIQIITLWSLDKARNSLRSLMYSSKDIIKHLDKGLAPFVL